MKDLIKIEKAIENSLRKRGKSKEKVGEKENMQQRLLQLLQEKITKSGAQFRIFILSPDTDEYLEVTSSEIGEVRNGFPHPSSGWIPPTEGPKPTKDLLRYEVVRKYLNAILNGRAEIEIVE